MDTQKRTEIIAFFSSHGYFRLKSPEKQLEKMTDIWQEYYTEFNLTGGEKYSSTTEVTNLLQEYQTAKREAAKAREKARLQKQANLPLSAGMNTSIDHIITKPSGKYVLTSAQNNTDIDINFFHALCIFCQENDATLLIARTTYNKQGFIQPDINVNELWYDAKIKKYLVSGQINLGDKFHFIADANVIPTARNPLSGFDGITKAGIHAIIPASKIALKVTAALKNAPTKILTSTGSITKRNYILRKAGTVASIEHNIGAVFINTETNEVRHLEQMEGFNGFYDKKNYYTSTHIEYNVNNVAVLQFGDIHAEKMENSNLENAMELALELSPKNIILHDVMDFSSRNHHNVKDSTFIHMQHVNKNTVKNDLKQVTKVIDFFASYARENDAVVHIIESNHDLAINTWLKNADFKQDAVNAVTYLSCMLALYKHQEKHKNNKFNMLKYAYTAIGKGKFGLTNTLQFHEIDESVIIANVEHGCHGHTGVNGSRGSPQQFRSLGIAMNTGHTHSPSIHGRVYTAGVTASLDMGYNIGASSWMIAHIVTYENGQRQIIFA